MDATINTNSHGVGGAGRPTPDPNTHGVVADCTNCSKLAPVGNNALEYNDPSENSERNTGQYSSITATKHTTANPKAPAQRRIRRILRWARSRGSAIPALLGHERVTTVMELLDLLAIGSQHLQ